MAAAVPPRVSPQQPDDDAKELDFDEDLAADGVAKLNRLKDSLSPYLRQHATNPVDWHEWGEEAFAEARRRNVPILLSVGYHSCHWCGVMERESFQNDATAELMNQWFVNGTFQTDAIRRTRSGSFAPSTTIWSNQLEDDDTCFSPFQSRSTGRSALTSIPST